MNRISFLRPLLPELQNIILQYLDRSALCTLRLASTESRKVIDAEHIRVVIRIQDYERMCYPKNPSNPQPRGMKYPQRQPIEPKKLLKEIAEKFWLVHGLSQFDPAIGLSVLKELFPRLEYLQVAAGSGNRFAAPLYLEALPPISHLDIRRVSRVECRGIGSLPLKKIFLPPWVTGSELESLPNTIQEIDLRVCFQIKDIQPISRWKNLKVLMVANQMADAEIELLPPSLEKLSICLNTRITDAGLNHLPSNLRYLRIDNCSQITSAGFASLPLYLETLILDKCTALTNDVLKGLPKRLRTLHLSRLPVDMEGLMQLRHTLDLTVVDCKNISSYQRDATPLIQ
eukprot:TRINITY_DN15219_c0_g1_i2.p1 TRINITY_DN15219_c0_g1~~TRINITY_DN15219_c0_g1_i2.p1  ORF type:complete len:343 (-),score=34.78 TRINITY_DN15219_c0_g1_i2:39-1067(-)